jgi:hypothetical protein
MQEDQLLSRKLQQLDEEEEGEKEKEETLDEDKGATFNSTFEMYAR